MQPTCDLPDIADICAMQVVRPLFRSFLTNPLPSRSSSSQVHLWPETVALTRHLLAIMLIFFILCLPVLSQSSAQITFRPETGYFIKDMERDGYGQLIIHNNWTMDTVAVLTDTNLKPLVAAYLRSMDTLKITGIKDGKYGLYFTVGNLWDQKEGRFKSVFGYYRYNAPMVFETDDIDDEIEYSIFELDLYQAGASNFVPDHFDFPDLSS